MKKNNGNEETQEEETQEEDTEDWPEIVPVSPYEDVPVRFPSTKPTKKVSSIKK